MKTNQSYLVVSLLAVLYTPQALAEQSQPASNNQTANSVDGISTIYSDIDMRMRLAAKPDAKPCSGDGCITNEAFDAQVQTIGAHLAQSAYATYPDLQKRVPHFTFGVAEKKVVGSASNASGTIILFRGVQHLDLGDEAIAFILAREMGHVIGDHHKSNTKTKLLISVLAGVLFPAVGILSASSAATQATTATSVLTSAASTATSIVGSEVAMSRMKPGQLMEADDIALVILAQDSLSAAQVAEALEFIPENQKSSGWEKDLNESTRYIRQQAGESHEVVAELEPLPEAPIPQELAVESPLADNAPSPEANTHAPSRAANAEQSPMVLAKATPYQAAHVLPNPPVEAPRKSILITNESLAQSRVAASPVSKTSTSKALSKKPIQSKSKTATHKSKKSAAKKSPAKITGVSKAKRTAKLKK